MNLIPQLEREGGHIVTLGLLFLVCLAITSWDPGNTLAVKAGDMTLGALLLAMRGNGDKPDFSQSNQPTKKEKETQT